MHLIHQRTWQKTPTPTPRILGSGCGDEMWAHQLDLQI
jgi:hypothetical protein